jgi:hypothetical protein
MRSLGIRLYRAAAPRRYRYDAPIQPQFDAFRRKLESLVRLNQEYDVQAAFHTHSYADTIGGSAWDLWAVLRDLDPRYIGLNFDIGHVTAKVAPVGARALERWSLFAFVLNQRFLLGKIIRQPARTMALAHADGLPR